ncbi:HESP057 [Hemileuca sp. nucleopolyhedrovirus]|uniref:HESP057 n=1 Tax=Hemileuca sp. nucleopolyhedrovirus TaxID=1367203 RepID=S5MQC5_9ABAC|nr:HESP057 [Hemileuca sp. nucleopolyhedrovirus]AGR56809.1 HESP057 [Hemileuca sp. nucleopolyhedrovirus]
MSEYNTPDVDHFNYHHDYHYHYENVNYEILEQIDRMEIQRRRQKEKSNARFLKDLCVTNLLKCNHYRNNFIEYNRVLPDHLKEMLIRKLFENDMSENNVTKNTGSIPNNWLNMSEKEFVELMYSNRQNCLYDADTLYDVVWINDRMCASCDTSLRHNANGRNLQSNDPIKKNNNDNHNWRCRVLKNDLNTNTYKRSITRLSGKNLNSVIFNITNWCEKCYTRPLFDIKIHSTTT